MARSFLLLAACGVIAAVALVCQVVLAVTGAAFALLGERGPTNELLVRGALVAAPGGLLLAHALVRGLARGWRGLDPELPAVRPGPWLLTLGASVALAALALVDVPVNPAAPDAPGGAAAVLDLALPALCAAGPTVVALVLALWRLLLAARPAVASSWCHVAALPPLLATAPLVLGAGGPGLARLGVGLWFFVGWGGLVAAPVAIGLLLEVVVRGRARAAEGASS